MHYKILSVDDDIDFLKTLKTFFELKGFEIETLADSNKALNVIQEKEFDCILLDVKMPGINGIELLKIAVNKYPPVPVIMISDKSNINNAVESMKNGAYDFIEKLVAPDELFSKVKNAISIKPTLYEKDHIYSEYNGKNTLIGKSNSFLKLLNEIDVIADTSAKVLIQGESGTGKELVAQALHYKSARKSKPYIKINCASIPFGLFESELFGHKKGAFTGAFNDQAGKVLAADGGTVFLDEIGDMELELQAKLLRVLEEDEITLVGSSEPKPIDVRFIAATNQNLAKKIEDGLFRKDLYHRLNVVNIIIPPLRERSEDIIPLAHHFFKSFNQTYNKNVISFTSQAEKMLLNYKWEGNVRELKNIIERLVIYSNSMEITANDLENIVPSIITKNIESKEFSAMEDFKTAKDIFEKDYIVNILNKTDWHIQKTADILKIDRTSLHRKMKRFGLTN